MAIGAFSSGLRGLPKLMKDAPVTRRQMPNPSRAAIAAAQRQGLSVDDLEMDMASWGDPVAGISDQAMPKAASGIFAPDKLDEGVGALGGVGVADMVQDNKTPAVGKLPAKMKEGPNWLDYVGLAGATLSQMGGQNGSINDFMDRRQAASQQEEMNGLLEGLDLSPEELGLVKAGMGKEVAVARVGDQKEAKIYGRNRADTVADRGVMRGYDVEDRDLQYDYLDTSREDQQTFDESQFDRTLGQNAQQHRDTMALGRDRLASDEEIASGKRSNGWGPAQLMSAYNKATTFVDQQEAALGDMQQVAAESSKFQETAKNSGSIGPGIDKAVTRFFSGVFGGDTNQLDRHTTAVSALMKKPNTGAWTDADQRVAESYAVNASNSPEANQFAANIANNRAVRQRDYVAFLREHIDETDPTSLQQAKQIWSAYAQEHPLFDEKGNALDPNDAPSIDEWLQTAMQGQGGGGQGGASGIPQEAVAELMKNPTPQEMKDFDAVFGAGAAQRAMNGTR